MALNGLKIAKMDSAVSTTPNSKQNKKTQDLSTTKLNTGHPRLKNQVCHHQDPKNYIFLHQNVNESGLPHKHHSRSKCQRQKYSNTMNGSIARSLWRWVNPPWIAVDLNRSSCNSLATRSTPLRVRQKIIVLPTLSMISVVIMVFTQGTSKWGSYISRKHS